MFRLIVGLGNPGKEYRDTRHNVGFMILDRLAARERAEFRTEKHWQAEVARTGDTLLCKPLTYMNLSGEAARAIGQFYKIEPAQTLVVLDDMALPLGKLRLRESGSAGGHNGLQSLIDCLGTQAIPRLRVGIGAAPGADRTKLTATGVRARRSTPGAGGISVPPTLGASTAQQPVEKPDAIRSMRRLDSRLGIKPNPHAERAGHLKLAHSRGHFQRAVRPWREPVGRRPRPSPPSASPPIPRSPPPAGWVSWCSPPHNFWSPTWWYWEFW